MMNKRILLIAVIDLAVFLIGVLGTAWFDHKGFLAFSVGAIAIVTFFGSLTLDIGLLSGDGPIRRAIAIAIVVMYLVVVAIFAFYEVPPPLEGLLLNFTTTTGVVIAFYFGSSAYLEARRIPERGRERESARVAGVQV